MPIEPRRTDSGTTFIGETATAASAFEHSSHMSLPHAAESALPIIVVSEAGNGPSAAQSYTAHAPLSSGRLKKAAVRHSDIAISSAPEH